MDQLPVLTVYVTFSNLLHLNKLSFLYETDKRRAPTTHKTVAGIKWDSIRKVYRIGTQQTLAIDTVPGFLNEDGDINVYCIPANICPTLNYYISYLKTQNSKYKITSY